MAFWGIEVKPGKPITHSCEKAARGRLRISQATLGIGEATKKTVVQCNVGNTSPVLLCALLPDKTESCHLDLEFAEADDVVFSVIGPRTVYLTGYYVTTGSRHSILHSDSESYGVDIESSDTDGSSYHSEDDDEYEDSFIDDRELQVLPPSPLSRSQPMDESDPQNDKRRGRQLKRKYRVIESDSDSDGHERDSDKDRYTISVFKKKIIDEKKSMSKTGEEDAQEALEVVPESDSDAHEQEDKYLLSVFKKKRDEKKTVSKTRETDAQEAHAKDIALRSSKLEEEIVPRVVVIDRADWEKDNEVPGDEIEELPKEVETVQEATVNNDKVLADGNTGENMAEANTVSHYLSTSDNNASIDVCETSGKQKKKRKEGAKKEEKTCEVDMGKDQIDIREDKEHEVEASTNLVIVANGQVSSLEMGIKSGKKSKKRRKELNVEGTCIEGTISTTCHNVPTDDKPEQGLLHIDSTIKDLPATSGEYQKQQTDNEAEEKIKRKTKKKTEDKGDSNTGVPDNQLDMSMKHEECQGTNDMPWTLSNGLSIQVLVNGPPDGKVAKPGKKVKIYYTASLKETGYIFDSNVGKSALKFRLGDETFIDGWSIGIDGMQVGEKRRLVVPPSMGFRNHEENVPPNPWLVYDVELVGVYR